MELLIPGLILVALMVYVSTRIKKSAAAAYEAETIETDDFVINKPAGFLTVIGGDPRFVFEAYTKEFGSEEAAEIRKATAQVTVFEKGSMPPISAAGDKLVSDDSEVIGGRSYHITESKRVSGNVGLRVLRKSAESEGRLVQLEIVALSETTDDFVRNIESMLRSFEVR